jgi:hypothetical protein
LEYLLRSSARSGDLWVRFGKQEFMPVLIMMSPESEVLTIHPCDRFPQLIDATGLGGTAGVATAMMVGFATLPTVLLQWRGRRWRGIPASN